MPVWMEILLNVIGYAGFIAIATFNRSSDETTGGDAPRPGCAFLQPHLTEHASRATQSRP